MKTQIVLGMAALALGAVAVSSFTPALAYRGDATVKGPNYTEERHEANVNSFKNGDYQAWVKNMQGKGVTRFVTEANFGEFAKAQIAAQNGDSTSLVAFRAKYGMGQGQRNGNGQGTHNGR